MEILSNVAKIFSGVRRTLPKKRACTTGKFDAEESAVLRF